MNLDLDELIRDWNCPKGELAARLVNGEDGGELLQLRIDVGLLQMFPDGRPDGQRYRGLPSVHEYVRRELRLGHAPTEQDWAELQRELVQLNYRRIALGNLVDAEAQRDDGEAERWHLFRAARDTDECLSVLQMMADHAGGAGANTALLPTLLFNRARLRSRLAALEGRVEEAVEEAEAGADLLGGTLGEIGLDPEQCEQDPGVSYLRQLGERLRRQHGIEQTLQERLEAALERDDFESAVQLREQLRRRRESQTPGSPAPDPRGD
jgi:hypothetical protein